MAGTRGEGMNPMQKDANDRQVVLVTGGARRIGAAIVQRLHRDGWKIAIHCHDSIAEAQALVNAFNATRQDSACRVDADLRDTGSLSDLVARVHSRWGRLDALVNNASSYFQTPLLQLDEADFSELIDTNLKAPLFLIKACLPYFGDSAAVVNILDALALRARPGFVIYNTAKAALWSATETLAAELAPRIRINAVAPGHILWAETAVVDRKQQQAELARVPLKHLGDPKQVAAAVAFLLSVEGSYVNGAVLPVDGGLRLQ